jgi:Ca2+-binding EF-hand superfamily protein
MSDKAVGSTSLRPPVPLDTNAMNAMLRADRDKDGTLSREELEHYDMGLAKRFKDVDNDRDGRLTLYEFEKLLGDPETSASR